MSIDFKFAYDTLVSSWPLFQYGILMTLLLAFVGTVAGFVIGLFVGAIRTVEVNELDTSAQKIIKKIVRFITGLYIWFFRGTPMMVQAVFFYYSFKPIFHWSALTAGLIIISINTGAYMAEIIRSGIQAVDNGQYEGSKALGMSEFQTLIFIIFPQAIKNTFPSIGNQLIVNIKDSCMLNAMAVTELFFQATSIAGSTMRYAEIYFIITIIYLILTTVATFILNLIEKRLRNTTQVESKDFCA